MLQPAVHQSELQVKDWIYNCYVRFWGCSLEELSPYPVEVYVSPHGQCLN